MLTELQKTKMTRLFNVFDADQNGVIERADYEGIVHNFAQIRGWEKVSPGYNALYDRFMLLWENMQKHLDKNEDNQVSLDEFLADHDQVLQSSSRYDLRIAIGELLFGVLDADGDGQGTVEELKLFYRALRIDEALAEKVFPKLDLNGDGYISKQEFFRIAHDFYYSNDPDAPGNWFFGPY